jgi:hypothetical protein
MKIVFIVIHLGCFPQNKKKQFRAGMLQETQDINIGNIFSLTKNRSNLRKKSLKPAL